MNEYIINHVLIALQVPIYKNTYDITCILIQHRVLNNYICFTTLTV